MSTRQSSKRMFIWFIAAAIVAVFFGIAVKSAQAGDPVPGIDISLEQIPGGIVAKATTGKDGRFSFDKLKQGKYVLRITPTLAKVENHNSSRSNKTFRTGPGGVEEHGVSIELRMEKRPGPAKYQDIP